MDLVGASTRPGKRVTVEDEKKRYEKLHAEFEPLTEVIKEVLGGKIENVIVSDKVFFSQNVCCTLCGVATSEQAPAGDLRGGTRQPRWLWCRCVCRDC